jgi:hypothetical protein
MGRGGRRCQVKGKLLKTGACFCAIAMTQKGGDIGYKEYGNNFLSE